MNILIKTKTKGKEMIRCNLVYTRGAMATVVL